jgi:hypothetical protein
MIQASDKKSEQGSITSFDIGAVIETPLIDIKAQAVKYEEFQDFDGDITVTADELGDFDVDVKLGEGTTVNKTMQPKVSATILFVKIEYEPDVKKVEIKTKSDE